MFVGFGPYDLEVGTAYGAGRVVRLSFAAFTAAKSSGPSDKSALNRLEPGVTAWACVYWPVDEPMAVFTLAFFVSAPNNNLDIVVVKRPL